MWKEQDDWVGKQGIHFQLALSKWERDQCFSVHSMLEEGGSSIGIALVGARQAPVEHSCFSTWWLPGPLGSRKASDESFWGRGGQGDRGTETAGWKGTGLAAQFHWN